MAGTIIAPVAATVPSTSTVEGGGVVSLVEEAVTAMAVTGAVPVPSAVEEGGVVSVVEEAVTAMAVTAVPVRSPGWRKMASRAAMFRSFLATTRLKVVIPIRFRCCRSPSG